MWLGWALVLALTGAEGRPDPQVRPQPHFDRPTRAVTFDEAIGLPSRLEAMVVRRRALAERIATDRKITGAVSQAQLLVQPGARVLPRAEQSFALQVMLTQSWNLTGLGRARKASAKLEREAFAAEIRSAQLELRLAAARTWIDLHTAERELALARREGEMAARWVERVEAGYAAELLLAADVAEARSYAAEVNSRALELEGRVHDLGLMLARDVSHDLAGPLATVGDPPVPDLPDEAAIAQAFARVEQLPEVRAQQIRATALQAYALEQRAQLNGSQMTLGATIDRDEPDGFLAYGIVGFSIPARGMGARQSGMATLESRRSEADASDTQRALASRLAIVRHDLHHTRVVADNLAHSLVPQLELTVSALTRAQTEGEGTVFEIFAARRRLLAAQAQLAVAEGASAWAKLQVWLLLAELEGQP